MESGDKTLFNLKLRKTVRVENVEKVGKADENLRTEGGVREHFK